MSITGRPKGMNNFQLHLNWSVLCKDLRHIEGFEIAENNEYIKYNLGKDEYFIITQDKEIDTLYHLSYTNGKFTMPCQDIKITGKIKQFRLYQGNGEEDLDEEDD